jgi:hypothetical protein
LNKFLYKSSTCGYPVLQTPFVAKTVFSLICFLSFCQNSDGCSYMGLFLDLPYYLFIYLHVCFCASTMLFLLLWLCSIIWNQLLWDLQLYSFYSGLLWLFRVFCASIWFDFSISWKMTLEFSWGLHWICRLILVV